MSKLLQRLDQSQQRAQPSSKKSLLDKGKKVLALFSLLSLSLGGLQSCKKPEPVQPDEPDHAKNHPVEYDVNYSALPSGCQIDTQQKTFTAPISTSESAILDFFRSGSVVDQDMLAGTSPSFQVKIVGGKTIEITLLGYNPETEQAEEKSFVYQLNRISDPIETTNLSSYNSLPDIDFEGNWSLTMKNMAKYMGVSGMKTLINGNVLNAVPGGKKIVVIDIQEGEGHKGDIPPGFWVNMQKILGEKIPLEVIDLGEDRGTTTANEIITNIIEKMNKYDENTFFMVERNRADSFYGWGDPSTSPIWDFFKSKTNAYVSLAEGVRSQFENLALEGQGKVCMPGLHHNTDGRYYTYYNRTGSGVTDPQTNDIPSFLIGGIDLGNTSGAAASTAAVFGLLGDFLSSMGYDLSKSSFNTLFADHPEFFEDAYRCYEDPDTREKVRTDEKVAHVLVFDKVVQHSGLLNLNPAIHGLKAGEKVPLLQHQERFANFDNFVMSKKLGIVEEDGQFFFDYDTFVNQGGNPEHLVNLSLLVNGLGPLLLGDSSTETAYFNPMHFTIEQSI